MKALWIETNRIFWNLAPDEEDFFVLDCLPGWYLVNPCCFVEINKSFNGSPRCPFIEFTFVYQDKLIMYTNGIMLTCQNEYYPNQDFMNDHEAVDIFISKVLLNLRFACKQETLPLEWLSFGIIEISNTNRNFQINKGEECCTESHHIKTAITREDIDYFSSHQLKPFQPSYDSVLLDAISAVYRHDYRTSILYSAIAMDSLVHQKLESALELALNSDIDGKALSINFSTTKMKEQKIKFLYDRLITSQKFEILIDVVSLLILGRSMKIIDRSLYNDSVKIYKTRNKIAHIGMSSPQNDLLISNIWNAIFSIKCAIRFVEFFGEHSGYAVREKGGMTVLFSAELVPSSLVEGR